MRLWFWNLCHGGMLGRSLSWFFLFFWGFWLVCFFSGGLLRGMALLIINIEGGAGYWIHVLGYSPMLVLKLALFVAVIELAFWISVEGAMLKGWPAWKSKKENEKDVRGLGDTAKVLDYLADKVDWRGDEEARNRWVFRHRYSALLLQGIWPGAFIFIGLPFAFKYNLRFAYPVLYLGNVIKITLFIVGWVAISPRLAFALFLAVLFLAERFKSKIATRE